MDLLSCIITSALVTVSDGMLRIFTRKLSLSENLRVLVQIPKEELDLWHGREAWSKAVGNVLMNGIKKIML